MPTSRPFPPDYQDRITRYKKGYIGLYRHIEVPSFLALPVIVSRSDPEIRSSKMDRLRQDFVILWPHRCCCNEVESV